MTNWVKQKNLNTWKIHDVKKKRPSVSKRMSSKIDYKIKKYTEKKKNTKMFKHT